MLRIGSRWKGGGRNGIEEPGAIQMHGNAVSRRQSTDPFYGRQRIDRAAAAVMRILQTDECSLNTVGICGTDRGFDLLRSHDAAVSHHPVQLHTGKRAGSALFVAV